VSLLQAGGNITLSFSQSIQSSKRHIFIVGPLPPPIHGASVVTSRVVELLRLHEHTVVLCNMAPAETTIPIRYHFSRIIAFLKSLGKLRHVNRESNVYFSLSGGLGLIYDLLLVTFSRAFGVRFIFHHHSFAYFSESNWIFRTIIKVAGRNQMHLALCQTMANRLHELYGSHLSCRVVSNIAFMEFPEPLGNCRSRRLQTLGYLSNISFEKGIDRFFDLIALLQSRGIPIKAKLAGPFANADVKKYSDARISELDGVSYEGPVYGSAKDSFLHSIDLLVMPSRYRNEAEPLVIYEALSFGIPVAVTSRGCIPDMASPSVAFFLDQEAIDLSKLTEIISTWHRNDAEYQKVLSAVAEYMMSVAARSKFNRECFLSCLAPSSP